MLELQFANTELQWNFGEDHVRTDRIIGYFIFISENAEAYQRFLGMLAHVKSSTLYRNPVICKNLERYLKLIEHELASVQVKEKDGNHIHLLNTFFGLISQCHYIYTNYVKYLPLYEDFEKL